MWRVSPQRNGGHGNHAMAYTLEHPPNLRGMQDFRRLRVWQSAHELSLAIKQLVRSFPKSVPSDAKSQLIRAADSIVANIVEGCGAATRKEFARYLDISIKSANEVDYRLQLGRDDGYITYKAWEPLARQVVAVRKMTFRLRSSVLAADEAAQKSRRAGGKASDR
jgi:four helix bundle protein